MKTIKLTRIIFSTITNKWYLQFNNLHELETTEKGAINLIDYYDLKEINMNRWELIN